MLRKQPFQFRKKCWHFGVVHSGGPRTQFLDALFDRAYFHDP